MLKMDGSVVGMPFDRKTLTLVVSVQPSSDVLLFTYVRSRNV